MRAVIDTNVVFEGLTTQGGASRLVIEAWLAGLFEPSVSSALAYEYWSVLTRNLSSTRMFRIEKVLTELLDRAYETEIYFRWRPSSRDPGDDFVIDCALNANAVLVTWNQKDFRQAQAELGLEVLSPIDFLKRFDETQSRRLS
ncbi:MAG: PIN domain-containing protein [Caldilineales bacterium]